MSREIEKNIYDQMKKERCVASICLVIAFVIDWQVDWGGGG